MIWEGDRSSLDLFIHMMNNNTKNIQLTWNISTESMVFLDLEIWKDNDHFRLCNYLKPTDQNAFIPLGSCHHKSWLCNIPRSYFVRLRRNCTEEEDFITQSQVLSSRFQQKGYDKSSLDSEKVWAMDRASLVSNKIKETSVSLKPS